MTDEQLAEIPVQPEAPEQSVLPTTTMQTEISTQPEAPVQSTASTLAEPLMSPQAPPSFIEPIPPTEPLQFVQEPPIQATMPVTPMQPIQPMQQPMQPIQVMQPMYQEPVYYAQTNRPMMPSQMMPGVQSTGKDGLAVASMVLGIVSFLLLCPGFYVGLFLILSGIAAILAIVFGAISIKTSRKAFAITGLVLGCIVLASIIVVFIIAYFAYEVFSQYDYNSRSPNDYI